MTISFIATASVCLICGMFCTSDGANAEDSKKSKYWIIAGILFIILVGIPNEYF